MGRILEFSSSQYNFCFWLQFESKYYISTSQPLLFSFFVRRVFLSLFFFFHHLSAAKLRHAQTEKHPITAQAKKLFVLISTQSLFKKSTIHTAFKSTHLYFVVEEVFRMQNCCRWFFSYSKKENFVNQM